VKAENVGKTFRLGDLHKTLYDIICCNAVTSSVRSHKYGRNIWYVLLAYRFQKVCQSKVFQWYCSTSVQVLTATVYILTATTTTSVTF